MAKQTRLIRGRKAKVKTMKRRKANAKTMKKPQRRTRLGLMKRKRFTRKVKRGGEWTYNEAQLRVAVADLDPVFKNECNKEADDCTDLIKAVKEYIKVYYKDTYIFFYIQKNDIDSEIKEIIIAYTKKYKFKIERIIVHLINSFILTRFIKFVKDVVVTSDDGDAWAKITELQSAIENYENINSSLLDWKTANSKNFTPSPEEDSTGYTYKYLQAYEKYEKKQAILDSEKNKLDKQQEKTIITLINKIKSIQIPESLRQSILTDEEKPPAQNVSLQVEKVPAPFYDIASQERSPNNNGEYDVFGADEDNEEEE